MANEYRGSKEDEWQTEGLCRFHEFKPSMPKGPVPYAKNQSTYGCYLRAPEDEFLGHFSRLSSMALSAEDQGKTTFISPDANYHYTVMPFRLKNVEATYQRMMTRMFRDKIGRMVEVHIYDMVVKSKQEVRHIEDLQGVFEVLR